MILTVGKLWGNGCPAFCDLGVKMGARAPKFLSEPLNIPISSSVAGLFPMCLTTGDKPSVMPASESAVVDDQLPTSVTLCSSPPCKDKVSAAMSAAAGSIPNKAQVCILSIIAIVAVLECRCRS